MILTSVLNLESFHQQKYLIKYCNMRVLLCMYQTLKLYLKTKQNWKCHEVSKKHCSIQFHSTQNKKEIIAHFVSNRIFVNHIDKSILHRNLCRYVLHFFSLHFLIYESEKSKKKSLECNFSTEFNYYIMIYSSKSILFNRSNNCTQAAKRTDYARNVTPAFSHHPFNLTKFVR